MTIAELELLLAHFSEEKEYIVDGYYRLRPIGEQQYQLAFLVPDSCGTSNVHPQITFSVVGEEISVESLLDMGVSPTKSVRASEATAHELSHALSELVKRFLAAKSLN